MTDKHDLPAKKFVKSKEIVAKKAKKNIELAEKVHFGKKQLRLRQPLLIGVEAKNPEDISIQKILIHQARLNYMSECKYWKAKFIMLNLKTQGIRYIGKLLY